MKFVIEMTAQEAAKAEEGKLIGAIAALSIDTADRPDPEPEKTPEAVAMPEVVPVPVQSPQPQTAATPQVGTVPTEAVSYTQNDLALAASQLMDAGKQPELLDLLQKFGVPSLVGLKTEQYGAFAAELRNMGAKI